MQVVLGIIVKYKFLFSSIFPSIWAHDTPSFSKCTSLMPHHVSQCCVCLSVIARQLRWQNQSSPGSRPTSSSTSSAAQTDHAISLIALFFWHLKCVLLGWFLTHLGSRCFQCCFLLKEHLSVSLFLLQADRTVEQTTHKTTVGTWLKMVVILQHPGHFTFMKWELGLFTRHF